MAKKLAPEVRIEPVDKGYVVHHSSPSSLDGLGKYKPPTKHLFPDAPSMITHITKTFAPRKVKSFKDALTELKGTSE